MTDRDLINSQDENHEVIIWFNLFHPSSRFTSISGTAIAEMGAISGICFRRFRLRTAQCSRDNPPGGRMKNDQGRGRNVWSVLPNEGGRERS